MNMQAVCQRIADIEKRRPEVPRVYRNDPKAAEIIGGLNAIILAEMSINLVKLNPGILEAVQAVCESAGVQW